MCACGWERDRDYWFTHFQEGAHDGEVAQPSRRWGSVLIIDSNLVDQIAQPGFEKSTRVLQIIVIYFCVCTSRLFRVRGTASLRLPIFWGRTRRGGICAPVNVTSLSDHSCSTTCPAASVGDIQPSATNTRKLNQQRAASSTDWFSWIEFSGILNTGSL